MSITCRCCLNTEQSCRREGEEGERAGEHGCRVVYELSINARESNVKMVEQRRFKNKNVTRRAVRCRLKEGGAKSTRRKGVDYDQSGTGFGRDATIVQTITWKPNKSE